MGHGSLRRETGVHHSIRMMAPVGGRMTAVVAWLVSSAASYWMVRLRVTVWVSWVAPLMELAVTWYWYVPEGA